MQILEILAQCKFVSSACHAHSNVHKPLQTSKNRWCERGYLGIHQI